MPKESRFATASEGVTIPGTEIDDDVADPLVPVLKEVWK